MNAMDKVRPLIMHPVKPEGDKCFDAAKFMDSRVNGGDAAIVGQPKRKIFVIWIIRVIAVRDLEHMACRRTGIWLRNCKLRAVAKIH